MTPKRKASDGPRLVRLSPMATESVSKMIRVAEKFMQEGRYTLAIEQLTLASELDPGNMYIGAIVERARHLQETDKRKFGSLEGFGPSSGFDGHRYLSVTVGKQFDNGIRQASDEPSSAEDVSVRVRQLTETAQILLKRGLGESAFESLMKAYLLDPVSPDVIACEQRVLPVWESIQEQRAADDASSNPALSGLRQLDSLLRQKEAELAERERMMMDQNFPGDPSPKKAQISHPASEAGNAGNRLRRRGR